MEELLEEEKNITIEVEKIDEKEELLEKMLLHEKKMKRSKRWITLLCLFTMIITPISSYYAIQSGRKKSEMKVAVENLQPVEKKEKFDTQNIAKIAGKSVVEIQVVEENVLESVQSAGSGVIISENGFIATNYHVIKNNSENTTLNVRLHDGQMFEAKVIGKDARTDLAVLKINKEGLIPTQFSDSSKVVVGEPAIAIGNSLGVLGGTVTQGIVSAVERESKIGTFKLPLIQTDAPVNRGNSGGGLFNESGQLIGIVTQKLSGETIEGLGFAIPSNTVSEITKQIIEHGFVKSRPTIGVRVQEIENRFGSFKQGVYVISSENEALKRYDLLLEVNGEKITSAEDILEAIKDKKVGDKIVIRLERERKVIEMDVILKEATQ